MHSPLTGFENLLTRDTQLSFFCLLAIHMPQAKPQTKPSNMRRATPAPQVQYQRSQKKKTRTKSANTRRLPGDLRKRVSARTAVYENGSESSLARAIALPNEFAGYRFPTASMPRTSTISLRDCQTVATDAMVPPGFSAGDVLFSLLGQPTCLGYYTGQVDAEALYKAQFITDLGTGTPIVTDYWRLLTGTLNYNYDNLQDWAPDSMMWMSGDKVHGRTMAIGSSASGRYVFLNPGDTIHTPLTTWTSNLAGQITFSVLQYSVDSEATIVASLTVAAVGGQCPATTWYTALEPGYFKLRFNGFASVTAGSVTNPEVKVYISVPATVGVARWHQVAMSELDPAINGDPILGCKTRVNASSLLLTNVSPEMFKQGTVLAARCQSKQFFDISRSDLTAAAEKYQGDAGKGCYTFMEYTEDRERFREYSNAKGLFIFDLDTPSFYHFIAISNASYLTQPNSYAMSFDTILEFQTDVPRYLKGVAHTPFDALVEARRHINSTQHWFYENPTHMEAIYNFLRRATRTALHYAPAVTRFASMIDPVRAPAYEAVGRAIKYIPVPS